MKKRNENAAELQSYLSVGIDIGADFSYMAIALPDGSMLGKPLKIVHSDPESRERAVQRIQEAQKSYSLRSRCFMEATGIYHIPLLCYLKDRGFDCIVINPIITKSSTNISVRQIPNDKFDAQKIAQVGLNRNLKTSMIPDDEIAALRDLARDYDDAATQRTKSVLKLTAHLKLVWPEYVKVFSKPTTKVSLAVLEA